MIDTHEYQYITSEIAYWDEERELWEVYVGTNEPGMPVYCIAVGKTELEALGKAELLAMVLNGGISVNNLRKI